MSHNNHNPPPRQPPPPGTGDYREAIDQARRRIVADIEASERQRRREIRFLKWTMAPAIVWAAYELHRLADRLAELMTH